MKSLSFCQKNNEYSRFVDSADIYIDISTNKAISFLDSIPKPIEENLKGRLADYYSIVALVQDDNIEEAKQHQSYILALHYAKKEKNFKVAGDACIELFSNIYLTQKDTTSYSYLEKAKYYYELGGYENGVLEVEQMYAYVEFLKGNSLECNNLLLRNLDRYNSVEDDKYFIMFAAYMLTNNYVDLRKLDKAHNYFNKFKELRGNSTTSIYNYLAFEGSTNLSFAESYLKSKQMDSSLYYLNKSKNVLKYMSEDAISKYYSLFIDYYKTTGDINSSKLYIDSLKTFESDIFEKTVKASLQISDSFLKAEEQLLVENEKKRFYNSVLVIVFACVLISFCFIYYIANKRNKIRLVEFENQVTNFSYLKTSNEKLSVKVQGLEEYIKNLKKEIKVISTLDISTQKDRIKGFYINLQHSSSTILDKTENHLDLINDLNINFFKQLQERYPKLNNSEIIICYYLFVGFKNKEIAVFLNSSIRAIESKRYRITKKIKLNNTTLSDHLKSSFEQETLI